MTMVYHMKTSVITVLIGLMIGMIFLCGCTGTNGTGANKSTDTALQSPAQMQKSDIQSVSITGSTTVLPIAAKAAEAYMKNHPGSDIQVTGGGSGVGVQSAGEGTAMIGMSSRDITDVETKKYPDMKKTQIAIDGVVFITNKGNPIPALTIDQIRKIYNGNITNWKDVGGSDAAIVVVGRDSSSGTRDYVHSDVLKNDDFVKTQLEKNSNGAIQQTIQQTPNAIGYVGLGYVDQNTNAIKLNVNGTIYEGTVQSVLANKYPAFPPALPSDQR